MNLKSRFLILTWAICSVTLSACSPAELEEPPKSQSYLDRLAEENHVSFNYDAGLRVGARVPKRINIVSEAGETNLEQLLEDGPAVLVFVRSVEWCSHCQAELVEVNTEVALAKAKGYQVYAISYDKPAILTKFAENKKLDFTLLSDEASALIDAFDLRDPQFTSGRGVGVAIATVMVVDKEGVIRGKTISGDHDDQPPKDQIATMLNSI